MMFTNKKCFNEIHEFTGFSRKIQNWAPMSAMVFRAICELGPTIGDVEEVDITSLNSKQIGGMTSLLIWARGLLHVNVAGSFWEKVLKEPKVTLILEEFIKDDEFFPSPAREKKKMNINKDLWKEMKI
ncbi:hypothetical protein ACJX0J_039272, partial [Zea mays]